MYESTIKSTLKETTHNLIHSNEQRNGLFAIDVLRIVLSSVMLKAIKITFGIIVTLKKYEYNTL